ARGTGARPDFTTGGAASGLGPNVSNWGVGFTVSFPIFEYAALRARSEAESHRERAEEARLQQVRRELDGRIEKARAMLEGARRVARVAPVFLEAARAAEQQSTARYRAGLGTVIEIAETQRLLTQAEIDNSLARLNVWRGLLAVAAAEGSLEGFLR
ncbi:MAG: TolC family protein, partial [Bryobacteraceae bacterium]